jgi:hypothetical protein
MKNIPLLCLFLLMASCGSKNKLTEAPVPAVTKKIFDTDIVINYRLLKTGIRDTFNRAIDEVLKEKFDIPEYDIKMVLTKTKEATVEMDDKSIMVNVPVGIQVEKKTFLTDLKAKGVLEMSFLTDIDLDSIWNLRSNTTLSHYRWSEKPKLNILGMNLPIEAISNKVLQQAKPEIEKSINISVKENFTLKEKMWSTVNMMTEPMQSESGMGGWVQLKPTAFLLSKIENTRSAAKGKILIKGTSNFTTYKPEYTPYDKLPKVFWENNIPDSSTLRLLADIRMADINVLIKENLDGRTFTADGKSITLSNIITNCDFEKIKVVTDVKGTVNGTLIITGRPVYDVAVNGFYTKDIDISFITKNVIHKAASWIAEGKIRKELAERMKFSVEEQLGEIQNSVNVQVAEYNKKYDMEMRVALGSVIVESFELKPGIIDAVMKVVFMLEANISDFRSFSKF